jgi:hypothetical protein
MIRYSRRTPKRNVSPTLSKLEMVKGFAPRRAQSLLYYGKNCNLSGSQFRGNVRNANQMPT